MSNYTDAAVTKLRAIMATIDHEIDAETVGAPQTPALRTAWKELVTLMALGAAPLTRVCPTCKSVGMRAASRCGQCWSALEPLPPIVTGADALEGGA